MWSASTFPLLRSRLHVSVVADARLGTLDTALAEGESFDTIILLGNNLGLLAGERQGRRLLRRLAGVATERGRLLAGSYDPTTVPPRSPGATTRGTANAGSWAVWNVSGSAISNTQHRGSTCSLPRGRRSSGSATEAAGL
jgi:hypothetical protein